MADERRIRRDDVAEQELAVALQQPVKEAQRIAELAPVEILHDGIDDDQVDRSRRNRVEFRVVEDADFRTAGVVRKQPGARAVGAVVEQQRPAGLRQVVGGKRVAAAPIQDDRRAAGRDEAADAAQNLGIVRLPVAPADIDRVRRIPEIQHKTSSQDFITRTSSHGPLLSAGDAGATGALRMSSICRRERVPEKHA